MTQKRQTKELLVLRPGTIVTFVESPKKIARVVGVSIREFGIEQYQVAWHSDGDRRSAWVYPSEIEFDHGHEKMKVGFVDGRSTNA